MSKIFYLLFAFLFSSCSKPRSEQTFVLFLGDSITQGDQAGGQGSGKTYPEQAVALLDKSRNGAYAMAVRAYPGKTAEWFLTHRLSALDSVDNKGYKLKIATLFFGANDLVYPEKGSSALPDSVLKYNSRIANYLIAKGYKVIVCPALDRANYPEFTDFNAKREHYNNLLRQEYEGSAVGLVPLDRQPLVFARGATKNLIYFAPGEKTGQSDGSHPNVAGAKLVGEAFARAIEAVAAKQPN